MKGQLTGPATTYAIGGELAVNRLGYGAMQIAGPGITGDPRRLDDAVQLLRRSVELGVTVIDTADSRGPFNTNLLVREALYPYPDDLVIAARAGLVPGVLNGGVQPGPTGCRNYMRRRVEQCLRHLGLEHLDLFQLDYLDPQLPLDEQLGTLTVLQQEGKIRHIGLAEVTVEEVRAAEAITPIASVQNLYNLGMRTAEPLVDYATERGIAFIPWFPLATGRLGQPDRELGRIAADRGVSPTQIALAWLLRRSPVMLPIPGTASIAELERNMAAVGIDLTDEEFALLDGASI
jgi:aryl-alcohol dehydrogenase-like predicted oxidoreductase